MNRFPDVPRLVSPDFLRKIDSEEPGRWLASSKINGRRRIAWKENGVWHYKAKNRDDAQQLQPELRAAFESMDWPDGIGVDAELAGPRHAGMAHSLHIFDLLMLDGEWLGAMPFHQRHETLALIWKNRQAQRGSGQTQDSIRLLTLFTNPGLLDRFMEQLQDPLSEGLVIRRRDSRLIGSSRQCAEHPHMFKLKHGTPPKEFLGGR